MNKRGMLSLLLTICCLTALIGCSGGSSSNSTGTTNPSNGPNNSSGDVAHGAASQVTVPDLTGLTPTAAASTLSNHNLILGSITNVDSATVPAGAIVAQNPPVGTLISSGSSVYPFISLGPPPGGYQLGVTSLPPTVAVVGKTLQYQLVATSSDRSTLAFSLNSAPAGMTIDATTGLLAWTPGPGQGGDQTVTVVAQDSTGQVSQNFTLSVFDTRQVVSAFITAAAGGTIIVNDSTSRINGLTITIPPGALNADKNFAVSELISPPTLGGTRHFLMKGFVVEPDGIALSKPATVTIPYDPNEFDTSQGIPLEGFLGVDYVNTTKGELIGLTDFSVDTVNHWLVGTIPHFSVYLLTNSARLCPPPLTTTETTTDCPNDYATSIETNKLPVILVHGFQFSLFPTFTSMGDESTWGNLRYMLKALDHGGSNRLDAWRFDWDTKTSTFEMSAGYLSMAIGYIKITSGKSEVNLVAHSFGGILVRTYLQGFGDAGGYNGDVNKVMTIGTPHQGIGFGYSTGLANECVLGSMSWLLPSPLPYYETCHEMAADNSGYYGEGIFIRQLNHQLSPSSATALPALHSPEMPQYDIIVGERNAPGSPEITDDGLISVAGAALCSADPSACDSSVPHRSIQVETITGLCHSPALIGLARPCSNATTMPMVHVLNETHPLWNKICTFLGGSDCLPPAVPNGLTVTVVSPSQLNLSWAANTEGDLAGYKIYRNGNLLSTVTGSVMTDTGLSPSTHYCYTILAYDMADNQSAQSSPSCATTLAVPDITAPAIPTNLTATAVSSSQINLSWTANTESDLAGYKIYKSGLYLKDVSANSTSDNGLIPSSQYCYTVAAYDFTGNVSAQTAQICATTLAIGSPPPPNNVTSVSGDAQVTMSWGAVPNATSYNLYWSTNSPVSKATGNKIAGVTSPYVHLGLTNGVIYYYVVTAANGNGESAESGEVAAKPTAGWSTARLAITETATPDPVRPGEKVLYTITATNLTSTLAGMAITATVPDRTTVAAVDRDGGSCGTLDVCPAGSTITWAFSSVIGGGQSRTVTFSALVDPSSPPADGTILHSVSAVSSSIATGRASAAADVVVKSMPPMMLGLVDGPDPTLPVTPLTYTLTYSNPRNVATSPTTVLSMTVPTGTSFASASPGYSVVGNTVKWTVGALAPGASGQSLLVVQVDASAADGSIVLGTADLYDSASFVSLARATAGTAVTSTPAMAITQSATPDPVMPGEKVLYTITATNRTSTLAGMAITATVPDRTTVAAVDRDGGSCGTLDVCPAGSTITWVFPSTMGGGQSKTVTFSSLVDPSSPPADGTVLHSVAAVSSSIAAGGASAAADVVVKSMPPMMLGLVDGPDPTLPGTSLTYTLTYSNPRNVATSPTTVLSMTVPTGTSFVSASPGYSVVGNIVKWTVGALAPGASGQSQLVVQVDASAADGSIVLGTADLYDSANSVSLARATVGTAVTRTPAMAITQSASPDPVMPGEKVLYTITATNLTSTLASMGITATVPDHTKVAAADRSGGNCNNLDVCPPGSTISWSFGTTTGLGQSKTVTFSALVDPSSPPANGTILHSVAAVSSSIAAGGASAMADVRVNSGP